MHMRCGFGPWLLAALLLGGCNEICPAVVRPAASCVRVASVSMGSQNLMVITPECGIVDSDVAVQSQFSGEIYSMHVDASGRSTSALSLFSGIQDQLVLSWGGDCKTHFCVKISGPGPARECDDSTGPLPE
jgi:hypothetical protein